MTATLLALVIYRFSKSTHHYFELILVVLALSVFANTSLNAFNVKHYANIGSFTDPFGLLIGPSFYFYLNFLIGHKQSWKKNICHALPFFLAVLLVIIYVSNYQLQSPFGTATKEFLIALSLSAYIQIWAYFFICRIQLKTYRNKLKLSCSEVDRLSETWISDSLAALLLCYSTLSVVYLLNHGSIYIPVNKSLAIILSLLIFYILYTVLRRPALFSGAIEVLSEQRYTKSGLNKDGITDIAIELRQFMTTERPHLDPDLSIASLAKQLDVKTHHLSQVINSSEGGNFYDFINTYRVKEVTTKLALPSHHQQTILSIAFDAGFSSKATFNRVFKKHTEMTPHSFRKKQRLKEN